MFEPKLTGMGDAPAFIPVGQTPSIVVPVISTGLNLAAFAWLAFSVALVLWALRRGPAATERRAAIKRAKGQLSKAKKMPRLAVRGI